MKYYIPLLILLVPIGLLGDTFIHTESTVTAATGGNTFVSRWNTTLTSYYSSPSDQVTLPLEASGTYNFVVDWGDGNTDTITSYNQSEVTHTYATSGVYTLSITGTLRGWSFNGFGDAIKIIEISQWGDFAFGNSGGYFYGAENLVLSATDAPDLNGTTTLSKTFMFASKLGSVGSVNAWDVSGITDMSDMFRFASDFNMSLSTWDVSNVTDMSNMFYYARSFNQPLNTWNVANVTTMSAMFAGASAFNMSLSSWNVSSVTDMTAMFSGASSFNQPLSTWDVSKVTTMYNMFSSATSFNQPLGVWDTSAVVSMSRMFESAVVFNQPLGSWNTSSVKYMYSMFNYATSFNQPLDSWDVSSVTTFYQMFYYATAFNQQLDSWNVSRATNMGAMFYFATSFNQSLNSWDTSEVTDMSSMFMYANSFNQPLGSWNVSSVTSMYSMFEYSTSFNQPLDQWDTSSVTDMTNMFHTASSFNQNLGNWNVTSVSSMSGLLFNTQLSTSNYDSLLNGWASQTLKSGITFSAGNSMYSPTGKSAHQFIIDTYDWTIYDGGLLGPPDIPKNLNFSPSNGSITIAWSVPAENGAPIQNYLVYRSLTNGSDYVNIGNSSMAAFVDTGLTNGVTYYYKVKAVNSNGQSNFSSSIAAVPSTAPSAPVNLTASVGQGYVTLTWAQPNDTGGLPISEYQIYRTPFSGSTTLAGTTTSLTFTDSGLIDGQTYIYLVKAVNSNGEGDYVEITAIPGRAPSSPLDVSATPGDGNITISWSSPFDQGSPIVYEYKVYRSTSSGEGYIFLGYSMDLSYIDTTIEIGVTYYYIVAAYNSLGDANSTEVSALVAGLTPATPPVTSWGYSNGEVFLVWTIPSDDGGSPITEYRIYRSTTSGSEYRLIANVSSTSFADENLTRGMTYFYVVTAVNIVGESEMSAEVSITIPVDVPNSPINPVASLSGNDVIISWESPQDNGGSNVTEYRVYRSTSQGSGYQLIGSTTETAYTDTTTEGGMKYYYVVTAVNSAGESEYSNEVGIQTETNSVSTSNTSTTTISDTSTTTTSSSVTDSSSSTLENSTSDSTVASTPINFIAVAVFLISGVVLRKRQMVID